MTRLLSLFALFLVIASPALAETIQFDADDGTTITAELTRTTPDAPFLVLFHMAGASRGEYVEIAPRLAALGYNTLAVDQRSGGAFGGVDNRTRAQFGANPSYADAIPDLIAAAAKARDLGAATLGVMGSSYSAALVLKLAGDDPDFTDAVIAFSPGEYFGKADYVRSSAARISQPVFITGGRQERSQWQPLFDSIPGDAKTGFQPQGAGRHGATALLTGDGPEYWAALETFLQRHLPVK
ncbi:MAG: alpha/beta hydrolase [Pseudomonadota bacterium]